jgi:hypothetical protein
MTAVATPDRARRYAIRRAARTLGHTWSPTAGGEATCALRGQHAWCWGDNHNGNLGDGTITESGVPVRVG